MIQSTGFTKRLCLIAVLLSATAAVPAKAAEQLDDAALADVRGGLDLGPFSNISFACTMTTSMNGQTVLTTTLSVTPQGEQMTQVAGAGTQSLSTAPQFGINVGPLPQTGVVVPGQGGGGTAVIQNAIGQMLNLVVNTANNQKIVQNIVLTLGVPDLTALSQQATQMSVNGTLAHSIGSSMLQFAGH